MPARFGYGSLLTESFRLPFLVPVPAAAAFLFGSLSLIALDLGWISDAWTLPTALVSIALEYWFLRALLSATGAIRDPAGRFPAFVGVSLITGIGIATGLILLVLPGLILLVRWSVALPLVVAEEAGIIDAMRRSWWGTGRGFWPILGVFLTIYLPWVVATVFYYLADTLPSLTEGNAYRWLIVAADLVTTISLIAGWAASVAIYLAPFPADPLEEIFS